MKFKSFLVAHKTLTRDVITSTCLLGASTGIVFGVSAATFKVEYMDLNNADRRFAAYQTTNYYDQDISSKWNVEGADCPNQSFINASNGKDWYSYHPGATTGTAPFENDRPTNMEISKEEGSSIGANAKQLRKKFTSMIIDGATHTAMDRSFNQSLLEGAADFIANQKLNSYDVQSIDNFKPSQDNNAEFVNIYQAVISDKDRFVVGLAGYNHAEPLQQMMVHKKDESGKTDIFATCQDAKNNANAQKTAFVLIDSAIPNNQCIASVLFRADQPGFFAGVATCEYFINNLQLYHDNYQDLTVAGYGGVSIPTVTIYLGGFQRGIELFNNFVLKPALNKGAELYFTDGSPSNSTESQLKKTFGLLAPYTKFKQTFDEIKELPVGERMSKYNSLDLQLKLYDEFSIKMIKLGDIGNHFSGTFATGDAIGITKQYLNRGASAIICVAGPQSLDTAQEIKNQNSKAIVIGVDTAMENSDYQRWHDGCSSCTPVNEQSGDSYWDNMKDENGNYSSESHAIIKFSALKDIKTVTNKINRLVAEGKNWDVGTSQPSSNNAICGPGFQTCGNIGNGLVSISWDGFRPLIEALKNITYHSKSAPGEELTFDDVWKQAVNDFAESYSDIWAGIPDDSEYKGDLSTTGIFNITNAEQFNKFKADGKTPTDYYKYYNVTTQILGSMLANVAVEFDRNLTLWKDSPDANIRKLEEGEKKYASILEWLSLNMYMSC